MPPEDNEQNEPIDDVTRLVLSAQFAGVTDIDEDNILERLTHLHNSGLLNEDGEEVYWELRDMINPYD